MGYDKLSTFYAAIIACCFVSISLFNILYPEPSGPADNGDFNRTFARFSNGPLGHEYWPDLSDQERYQKRFFNYYHRFWRLGTEHRRATHYSSSHLVYLPGRLLNPVPGLYDLAWNSLLVLLLVGWTLFHALKRLMGTSATWSAGLLVIILADANIIGYINSFYQESGALVFFALLVVMLYLFWVHHDFLSLTAVVAMSLLLTATKTPFAFSVPIITLPVLVAVGLRQKRGVELRRYLLLGSLAIVLGSICLMICFSKTPGNERRANCYHFIFYGVLPRISEGEGKAFLLRLGLDESLVRLSGKSAYAGDSELETPILKETLTKDLHVKALVHSIVYHPKAFFDLVSLSFEKTGRYPTLLYLSETALSRAVPLHRLDYWSQLHNRYFRGTSLYLLTLAAGLGLLISGFATKGLSAVLPHLLLTGGCFFGSIMQTLIAVIGNGPADLVKHLYFANLLLDTAFVSTVGALVFMVFEKGKATVATRWNRTAIPG